MSWVAAAVAGGAVVGSLVSANGARGAAQTQADAANNAANMQWQQYQQTRDDLSPYTNIGSSSINSLLQAMGYTPQYGSDGKMTGMSQNGGNILQQQFAFNPGDLTQTPGYQFNYGQGMRAATNSAAARGLGLSGAQIKGAQTFASGLADNTYQNQFNNALNTYQTNYNSAANNVNRLSGLVQLGQNSAAQVGSQGLTAASNSGNLLTQAANANASGQIGTANAINSAISGVGQGIIYRNLYGNTGSTASMTPQWV